jgi:hypothetical protein
VCKHISVQEYQRTLNLVIYSLSYVVYNTRYMRMWDETHVLYLLHTHPPSYCVQDVTKLTFTVDGILILLVVSQRVSSVVKRDQCSQFWLILLPLVRDLGTLLPSPTLAWPVAQGSSLHLWCPLWCGRSRQCGCTWWLWYLVNLLSVKSQTNKVPMRNRLLMGRKCSMHRTGKYYCNQDRVRKKN